MNWTRFKEIATKEKFNSNNAWGFGGKDGTRYILNLGGNVFVFENGKFRYRHADPQPYKIYVVNGLEVKKTQFEEEVVKCTKD